LPVSNKKAQPFHYLLLVTWLTLVVLAAIYFIGLRLVLFDPTNKLQSIESNTLVKQIHQLDSLTNKDLSNAIIHFTSASCRCTQFSDDHKSAINQTAKSNNFNIFNVQLSSKNNRSIIPSTPSVLLLDGTGNLLYFGPYSEGLACSQSNGLVELVMSNYKKGFNSHLIVNEAKGCYCNI